VDVLIHVHTFIVSEFIIVANDDAVDDVGILYLNDNLHWLRSVKFDYHTKAITTTAATAAVGAVERPATATTTSAVVATIAPVASRRTGVSVGTRAAGATDAIR
jgi:hypothetical protein